MSKSFLKGPPDSFDTILTLEQKWLNKGQSTGTLPSDPIVTAWVSRVQANGAAAPSANTQSAVNTFWAACKSAGIDSKMICLNCFAPDNWITAITPLVVGSGGLNKWNDVLGDLQGAQSNLTNGIVGNHHGALDTGVVMNNQGLTVPDLGLSGYVSVPDATNHNVGGCDDYNARTDQNKWQFYFQFTAYGNVSNGDYAQTANVGPFTGFASMNVLPTWSYGVYAYGKFNGGSTVNPFGTMAITGGNGASHSGGLVFPNTFWWFNTNGNFPDPSGCGLSFAAIHHGLTQAQAQALFNAVQAMRVSFGGGYV